MEAKMKSDEFTEDEREFLKGERPYIVLDDSTPYKRELRRKFEDDSNYEIHEEFETTIIID
jgi:hypothetical protein